MYNDDYNIWLVSRLCISVDVLIDMSIYFSLQVSFLDYMCYIPLFLSMHDNICDHPLDMSPQQYQVPPRRRPPSVQRDMNPLSQPLGKISAFALKKKATDFESGVANPEDFSPEYMQSVNKYAR